LLDLANTITVRAHTRFADFPQHKHNYVEIMYVCSGEIEHLINGQDHITAQAGDLIMFNQHAMHEIKAAQFSDVAVNFIVLPPFFDEVLARLGTNNILSDFILGSLKKDGNTVSYLHFVVQDILPVRNLVENLVWSLKFKDSEMLSMNQQTIALIMQILLMHTEYLTTSDAHHCKNPLVNAVLREIEHNYTKVSLSDLAEQFKVNLAYLSAEIKRECGVNFGELLRDKRIERARYLLTNTELTNEEIAEAIGYETTSYFYRMFKRSVGMSPKEFRGSIS
ncbi:MAG: AraC family transcriptional regulator, partial [Gallicola sp.]|nr:AraC family transcriptional regulator [Gallicola sp.]